MKSKGQFLIWCLALLWASGSSTYAQTGTCRDVFPFHPHFETGFLFWENNPNDDFDWTRQQGATPSSQTGPSAAHVGDYYAYTEATGNLSSEAQLVSSCIDFSFRKNPFLSFRYHMQGADIGSLKVDVAEQGGTNWVNLFDVSGAQGSGWIYQKIDLAAYTGKVIRLRFLATTTNGDQGDIAIDGCYLYAEKACVGPTKFSEVQDFESGMGDWTSQSASDWSVNYFDPMAEPSLACQGLQFAQLASPTAVGDQNAGTLISPCVLVSEQLIATASFCYYLDETNANSGSGQLDVDVSTDDGATWTPELTLTAEHSSWQTASVGLGAYVGEVVRLRFRGQLSGLAVLALDDIRIHAGNNKRLAMAESSAPATFRIYPNPAHQRTTLEWQQDQNETVTVELVGMEGKVLHRKETSGQKGLNRLEIELPQVAHGLYQVRLRVGKQVTHTLLQLQHP